MSNLPQGFHEKLRDWLGPHPGTILFTALFFLIFAGLIWYLCGEVSNAKSDPANAATNRLIALFGGLVGWGLGMVFAPYSKQDEARFEAVGKVLVAFASGYLVSKFEVYVNQALFPFHDNIDSWIQLCIFLVSLLLGALTVFTNRLYAFKVISQKTDT